MFAFCCEVSVVVCVCVCVYEMSHCVFIVFVRNKKAISYSDFLDDDDGKALIFSLVLHL